MAEMVTKYIRIHPKSKSPKPDRTHNRVGRYIVFGIIFVEDRGWYKLNLERSQWAYLAQVRQKQEDPHTPFVFDIATEEERKEIDSQEVRGKLLVTQETVDLTTRDLRDAPGRVVTSADRAREVRIAKAEGTYEVPGTEDVTAPSPVKRRPGRPRKVGATQG